MALWLLLWCAPIELGQSGQWQQALPGYQFNFPGDHASHPEYKIEWWYYTGNLKSGQGERFGFQLTFFRVGIDPKPENPSRWAVRDLFIAHLAVTDIMRGRFQFSDRMNRAGVGWAGAATQSYQVWNEDWAARLDDHGKHHLAARDGMIGIDLELEPGISPVIHGQNGISQKGAQPGNASHYYSLTRMPTQGTLSSGGKQHHVEGFSWMDHEFGTSFLEAGQVGWDWFSIQLNDGTDLMLFQLRRSDGSRDPHSSGTLVGPSGESNAIEREEFELRPGIIWMSPHTGARYPTQWQVSIPKRGLQLSAIAALDDQELRTEASTRVAYWEGAIRVDGTHNGRRVQGLGYLEMTGYTGKPMSETFR